jgi:pimeloyl-ACP methyl ester carboxylesterase
MQALAKSGVLCFSVEYRRIPGAPEIMYGDVAAAVCEASRHVAGRPTVLAGHSAGGFLALHHAERHPLQSWQRVVALAPVTDLADARRQALGEGAVDLMFSEVADDDHQLGPIVGSQVMILHGEADTRVPLTMSRDYCARTGAELREIPETGHFSLIDPEGPAWPVVADALSSGTTTETA